MHWTSVLVLGWKPDQLIEKVCCKIDVTPPFQNVSTGSFNLHILPTNAIVCFRHANVISLILRFCFSEKEKPSFTSHLKPSLHTWLKANSRIRHPLSYLSVCYILTWRAAQTKRHLSKNKAYTKNLITKLLLNDLACNNNTKKQQR